MNADSTSVTSAQFSAHFTLLDFKWKHRYFAVLDIVVDLTSRKSLKWLIYEFHLVWGPFLMIFLHMFINNDIQCLSSLILYTTKSRRGSLGFFFSGTDMYVLIREAEISIFGFSCCFCRTALFVPLHGCFRFLKGYPFTCIGEVLGNCYHLFLTMNFVRSLMA